MKHLIATVLHYTAVAPSSHNTQPWSIRATKDDFIYLYPDLSRRLPYSDPQNRELYISLGAALQNSIFALQGLGYKYELRYFPKEDQDAVALIKVLLKQTKTNPEILQTMKARHSNRNLYQNKPIPKTILSKWEKLANQYGAKLYLIQDPNTKGVVASLVAAATLEAMANKKFCQELAKWLRHNLSKSHDGMPGYSQNMPTPMSLVAPFMIKHFNLGPMQAKLEHKLVMSSPVIAILSNKNEKLSWLKTGQAYESIILDATKRDIKNATMTAAIEIGQHHKQLMRLLNTTQRPLVMFRLGYCDKTVKPTPKRSYQEILRN